MLQKKVKIANRGQSEPKLGHKRLSQKGLIITKTYDQLQKLSKAAFQNSIPLAEMAQSDRSYRLKDYYYLRLGRAGQERSRTMIAS